MPDKSKVGIRGSVNIRVDREVYNKLLELRAELELKRKHRVSIGDAVYFVVTGKERVK